MTDILAAPPSRPIFAPAVALIEQALPQWVLSLIVRAGAASVFFLSGRTKVDGVLHITDGTYYLFAEEYRIPLIPSDVAAHLATYAEHLCPILIVLGLATRLSALALLGMTLAIQLFVVPSGWPTHLLWAGLLLYLVRFGAGPISLDRVFRLP